MQMFTSKKLEFKISETDFKAGKECCAYGCKNKPNPKKVGLCHRHYHIYRRQKDPVYDRFVNFRGNALRRGKPFEITLQEFRDWCNEKGYIIKKGMRGMKCTVDRINNKLGYSIDNIQLMTIYKNIEKYNTEDKNSEDFVPF